VNLVLINVKPVQKHLLNVFLVIQIEIFLKIVNAIQVIFNLNKIFLVLFAHTNAKNVLILHNVLLA
jgi:hypothetical protein